MGFQINQVVVSGNLTRPPETRHTPGGLAITRLGIAHNERRKNGQTQQYEDRAHFFEVTVFGGQGDWLAKNLGKGDPITVSGSLEWQQWKDKHTGDSREMVAIVARDVVPGHRPQGQGGGRSSSGYDDTAAYGYGTPPQQP